jgi:hypothetical protein
MYYTILIGTPTKNYYYEVIIIGACINIQTAILHAKFNIFCSDQSSSAANVPRRRQTLPAMPVPPDNEPPPMVRGMPKYYAY